MTSEYQKITLAYPSIVTIHLSCIFLFCFSKTWQWKFNRRAYCSVSSGISSSSHFSISTPTTSISDAYGCSSFSPTSSIRLWSKSTIARYSCSVWGTNRISEIEAMPLRPFAFLKQALLLLPFATGRTARVSVGMALIETPLRL